MGISDLKFSIGNFCMEIYNPNFRKFRIGISNLNFQYRILVREFQM